MVYEFNGYDYTVLVLVFLISIFIGVYHGMRSYFERVISKFNLNICKKKQTDSTDSKTQLKEYLVANSSMGIVPIALSLLASSISSIALLGNPVEVYEYGIENIWYTIGLLITPVIGAYLTGPMFVRLKLLSAFEYINLRFKSKILYIILVMCYIVRCIVYTGIIIFGAATTISVLTGLNSNWAIIIIGAVATFYTTIGGIKAVIWSDVFQMCIMLLGVIVIIVKGIIDVQGFGNLVEINRKGGRFNFFNFNPNPFVRQNFWALLSGGIVQFGVPYCIDQIMVQRFVAAKDTETAQLAMLINAPATFTYNILLFTIGMVLYATYHNCDPITYSKITGVTNPNQLLTYFVTNQLNAIKGMTGLFLSTVLCSSLSSISSLLNSLSAIVWADILKIQVILACLAIKKTTITVKLVVLISGALCTLVSLIVSTLGLNLFQIYVLFVGSFNAPIFGLYILGCMFSFTNKYGAILGSIIGFVFGLWLSYGSFLMKPAYPKLMVGVECTNSTFQVPYNLTVRLSEAYNRTGSKEVINLTGFNKVYGTSFVVIPVVSTVIVIAIGVIVSLLTGGLKQKIDGSLLLFKFSSKERITKSENSLKENFTEENLSLYNFKN